MDTTSAYNKWAQTYDIQKNATRDLDEKIVTDSLHLFENKCVVEAGCGTGKNSEQFLPVAKTVFCMDFSKKMLMAAKRKCDSPKASFIISDMTSKWPYSPAFSDIVTISLVLEHIENIDFVIGQAFRILKPIGTLFINELHPDKQMGGSVAHFELNDKLVKLTSFYHSKSDYENAGKKAGFINIKMDDVFDPNDNSKSPRILSIQMKK